MRKDKNSSLWMEDDEPTLDREFVEETDTATVQPGNEQKRKTIRYLVIGFAILCFIIGFLSTDTVRNVLGKRDYSISSTQEVIDISGKTKSGLILEDNTLGADERVEQTSNPLAGKTVFLSGLADSTVNSHTVVYLENPKDNSDDIYMKYVITYSGIEVFTTGLIPAGEAIEWIIGDTLTVGDYDLSFTQIPFWDDGSGTYYQLTGGSNTVHFRVVK